MKNKFLFILFILFIILQSCKGQNSEITDVISKYNKEDFSCLKNVFINVRGRSHNDTIVLLINKYRFKYSPYIVTVNLNTKEIVNIDSKLAERDCKNYFTLDEIKNFTKCFLKYNFEVLAVDNDENVYINPNQQNTPILLRKVKSSNPIDFKDFKSYKGNWYIRK